MLERKENQTLTNKEKTGNTKKTFKYYAGTALLFFLFLAIFDRGFFYLLSQWEKGFYKKNHLQRIFFQRRDFNKHFLHLPKGTYNTLIFGSSRTHRGIHPFHIHKDLGQSAFKIAKGKISIKFNYYFYFEYKKYAGTPDVVIYGLDYFMFKRESHPFFLKSISGEDIGSKKHGGGPLLLVSNKKRFDTLLNDALEQFNAPPPVPEAPAPAAAAIDPFTGYDKGGKDELVHQKSSNAKTFDYAPYPGMEGEFFLKLLDQLKKDGVQVVLVSLPDYIGTYESNREYGDFMKDIRELAARYSCVTVYDYNHPGRFDLSNRGYFLDGGWGKTNSHLSREGADAFHRMFLPELRKHYHE